MFKAISIDDEKAANCCLESMAGKNKHINIIASFRDPLEGYENIKKHLPQVVFLDISMPEMSGLYLAEQIIKACPQTAIVFVTSHDTYALQAFELNALDYLLKPLSQERFDKCIAKLLRYGLNIPSSESLYNISTDFKESVKKIFVEDKGETILLKPEDIYYFEVRDKTVFIKTRTENYSSLSSLGYFETKLQNNNFYRSHRSYIINLDKVSRLIYFGKIICEVGFADIKETALVSKNNVPTLKKLLKY